MDAPLTLTGTSDDLRATIKLNIEAYLDLIGDDDIDTDELAENVLANLRRQHSATEEQR